MKKAFDQTVRDLKREVNKKVLKVPRIEQKVLDATSNEPWGPHGSVLADIAHATRNYAEFQIIMSIIWKRVNDTGKNWRHVYKGLTVLEYLVAHGSEKVIDEIREHSYQIATLSDFQYISSSGRDEGSNVRKKSQNLVALVNDKERIQEVRQKAHANRDKYRGSFSTGRTQHPGSYSGGGSYGDQYDDDQYHGSYGSREDHRNGYGRDDERYGRKDPYGRDGDRNDRDADDYRGNRGNEDYQFGSRNRNSDRDRGRSFDEDDRYSSRSGGGRMDDPPQDERKVERKFSEQNLDAPPSYEEAVGESQKQVQNERDGGVGQAPAAKLPAPDTALKASPSESVNLAQAPAVSTVLHAQKEEVEAFDEFDPRGSNAAAAPNNGVAEADFFGLSGVESISSLALVPVDAPTSTGEQHLPNNSGSTHSLSTPFDGFNQTGENPFGEPPFRADPAPQNASSAPVQQQSGLSASPFPLFPAQLSSSLEPSSVVGEKNSFAAPDPTVNGHHLPSFDPSLPSGLATLQPNTVIMETPQVFPSPPMDTLPSIPANNVLTQPYPSSFAAPQQGFPSAVNPLASPYPFAAQGGFTATGAAPPQSFPQEHFAQSVPAPTTLSSLGVAPSTTQADVLVKSVPPPAKAKDKFETKSTVWADTLSRGLVDLNISGPKTNPLADIGVDFDSINRKEKRKEKEKAASVPVSTITMGKAMGAGSGIGRAGAGGLAPPPNPMVGPGMGMGMGMGGYAGGGINQPMGMGMGMGMGMNMGMGMGMGMNMGMAPGALPPGGMPPHPPMRGNGYNPMAGMGGYSSQQYGGYR